MATKINADTSSGLELTSDTSGQLELQSAGSTKVTVDTSGNMTVTGNVTATNVNATDITVTGNLTTNKAYFSAYANASQTNIGSSSTNGGTICLINQVWENTGEFSLSSGRVTINKTGKFHIIADMGTYASSESASRSQSLGRIYYNGSMITGSLMWIYNREGNDADEGHGNATASIIDNITSGDIIDIRGYRYSGGDTIGFRANSSRITIIEL